IRDQSHGVGKIGFRRKEVQDGAFGKSAVSDLAATGSAHRLNLAEAEGREVVVQHEALEDVLREQKIEALDIFLGAKGERGQRLRFAAGKERGTVNAW